MLAPAKPTYSIEIEEVILQIVFQTMEDDLHQSRSKQEYTLQGLQ